MKYKFIEGLTSDVMFEAYGKSLEELLENAALALFEVVCQIKKIEPKKRIEVEVEAENLNSLVYEFLSNLLTESEIEELFLCKFDVSVKKNKIFKLKAKAWGEPISPEKGGTVVKAVTYYGLKAEKTAEGFKARITLDI
jgi:SHS2 domain-containing protein